MKLWVIEVKDLLVKKKYLCELCLDDVFYVCIMGKFKMDNVFWGEYFEFYNLLFLCIVIVYLYWEIDKKKKKECNSYLGLVSLFVVLVVGW